VTSAPHRPRSPRLRFGAYAPTGLDDDGLLGLERAIGRQLDIAHFFVGWGGHANAFDSAAIRAAADPGRDILITWEPWIPEGPSYQPDFSLQSILTGRHDRYIHGWAQAIARYGRPLTLRPMHEMNGHHYPWSALDPENSPGRFQAVWRRLRSSFAHEGAHNVRWLWSPTADAPRPLGFEPYYPGSWLVELLGLSSFNWGASQPGHGQWRSFEAIFGDPYRRIAALGDQPIWITETACAPDGGDKAAWVSDMFQSLATPRFSRVEALIWFHARKERDWRATDPPAVVDSFRAGLACPSPGR
jgi:beta-mannanase